jgi:LysR family transcriptional regulator, transcriptional activator for bauABCD operon
MAHQCCACNPAYAPSIAQIGRVEGGGRHFLRIKADPVYSVAAMNAYLPQLQDADIRLLKIFKTVVECGGFSASEEALGVGRSTISKNIADLEVRLGVRLCERGRAGFRISSHGKAVYQATVELLDSIEQFRSKIIRAKESLSGELSVWLMDNTSDETNNPVRQALARFRSRAGTVALTLNSAAPDAVEHAIASRRAHVGLSLACSHLPGLIYQAVTQEHASLYCGQGHPLFDRRATDLDPEQLGNYDFVGRGYLVAKPTVSGPRGRPSTLALHVEATLQLLLTGAYLGVIPDHIALRWVNNGQLRLLPFADFRTSTPVHLIVREQSLAIPAVKAFTDDLAACYLEK